MSLPVFSVVQVRQKLANPAAVDAQFDPIYYRLGGHSYDLELRGWVVGTAAPMSTVQVFAGNQLVASAPVAEPSPELGERFPAQPWASAARFTLTLSAFDVTDVFRLRLRAVPADGEPIRIGSVKGTRRRELSSHLPRFQPLSLTTIGRTGSTSVMRLLSEHPEIVIFRQYPYEARPAKYWLHLMRVLSGTPQPEKTVGQPNQFHLELMAVGANPFRPPAFTPLPAHEAWSHGPYIERLLNFCQQSIDDWYGIVAEDQGTPGARYFAEKQFPDEIPPLLGALYPESREIFLVRDFRDMAASMLAYNDRRGTADFSRGQFATDAEWIAAIGPSVHRLMMAWRRREKTALLVKYEDLVAAPEATLTTMFTYLGVDASPETVAATLAKAAADEAERTRHQTAPSSAASVGRWRNDFTPELRELATEVFGPALRAFGYEAPLPSDTADDEGDEESGA